MKKLCIFLAALTVFSTLALFSCGVKPTFEFTLLEDGTYQISAVNGSKNLKQIEIPTEHEGIAVTAIGDYAFQGFEKLESVTVPNGITSLGIQSFSDCIKLRSVSLPEGISVIPSSCFANCSELTEINVPSSVTSIESDAFAGCHTLIDYSVESKTAGYVGKWLIYDGNITPTLQIKEDTVGIADYTFFNSAITEIVIPDSVKYIGNAAFNDSNIERITFGKGLKTVGQSAFQGCKSLKKIDIPSELPWYSVEFADENSTPLYIDGSEPGFDLLFDGEELQYSTSLEIPDGVERIGSYSIAYFQKVYNKIVIPDTLKSVGKDAFLSTSIDVICISDLDAWLDIDFETLYSNPISGNGGGMKLNDEMIYTLEIPAGTEKLKPFLFAGNQALTRVVFPESLTEIGEGVFDGCSRLESFNIDENFCVKRIGDSAFASCSSLPAVIVPDSVEYIGAYAFAHCGSVKKIVIGANVSYIGQWAFCNYPEIYSIEFSDPDGWFVTPPDSLEKISIDPQTEGAYLFADEKNNGVKNKYEGYVWTKE